MIHLADPWRLVVLAFLPLVLLRLRDFPWRSAVRRGAAWLCLALALVGPEIRWGSGPEPVMLVVDVSASASHSLQAATASVRELLRSVSGGAPVGAVGFAATPHLTAMPDSRGKADASGLWDRLAAEPERVMPADEREETDIAAGLDLAGWALPSDRGGRLLLVSDGWETRGDVQRVVRDLARRDVVVDTLPLSPTPPGVVDAAVEAVEAPARVPQGMPFEVRATVRTTQPGPAIVSLVADGVPIGRQETRLNRGDTEVAFPVAAEEVGARRYGVRVTMPGDEEPRNDLAETSVVVAGRPRILWLGGARLAPSGSDFLVTPAAPAGEADLGRRLAEFDAVVLADVQADELPANFAERIRHYVVHLGGGFLMLGGVHSFGPGGYRGTPIESILPVTLDPGDRRTRAGLGVVVVLDKSGSMAEAMGDMPKIRAARDAVCAAAALLEPGDRLGLLAFDGAPTRVIPLQDVPARGQLQLVLDEVRPGGGTRILPALAEAGAMLQAFHGGRRQIILVTDGRGEGGDFAGAARRLKADRITLSAVAVGEDADLPLLRELASAGGGRMEIARDAGRLAGALRREIAVARGPLIHEGRTAVVASAHPVLGAAATEPLPPLFGYVATAPRAFAAVPLRAETGEPLLALGTIGLGRAAAVTTDLGGPWGGEWRRWNGTPRLLANVLSWLLRAPQAEQIAVRQEAAGTGWRLVVHATSEEGDYLDGRTLQAHLQRAEHPETTLPLHQRGPGTYEAGLPFRLMPSTLVVLEDRSDGEGRILARTRIGSTYPDEYRIRGPHQPVLEGIRRASGGRSLEARGSGLELRNKTPQGIRLWQGLAWVGLGLFLLDVTLTRTSRPTRHRPGVRSVE